MILLDSFGPTGGLFGDISSLRRGLRRNLECGGGAGGGALKLLDLQLTLTSQIKKKGFCSYMITYQTEVLQFFFCNLFFFLPTLLPPASRLLACVFLQHTTVSRRPTRHSVATQAFQLCTPPQLGFKKTSMLGG